MMNRRAFRFLLAAAAFAVSLNARSQDLVVFAAASLQNAFEEIAAQYQRSNGRRVRLSFAASSTLARQIEQGAPAAVFASADEEWMDYLHRRQLIVEDTRQTMLGNRLVLIVPADRPMQVELKPGFDMTALVGTHGRWVTGDPASVPVGRYAQQALQTLGAWASASQRLVRAENVRVALTFVERGEAAAGIVYSTDAATTKRVHVAGTFPPSSHAPIAYPVAVLRQHDSPAAREFVLFLGNAYARGVFQRFGFSLPPQ